MPSSLVVQTSFLGDAVLTTPLLSQLANRGAVDVVTTPASSSLLAGHPAVREVIAYDKRGADAGPLGFLRLASRLRAARYETAYLAQGSLRSALLALAARVPSRVGFATSAGSWLYTTKVPYRDDLHHAARLLQLSRPNGREPTEAETRPSLAPGDAERDLVRALLARAGVEGQPAIEALRVLIVYTIGFAAFDRPRADAAVPAAELAGNFDRGLGWLLAGVTGAEGR